MADLSASHSWGRRSSKIGPPSVRTPNGALPSSPLAEPTQSQESAHSATGRKSGSHCTSSAVISLHADRGVIEVVYQGYTASTGAPGVAWIAHLVGLGTGAGAALALRKWSAPQRLAQAKVATTYDGHHPSAALALDFLVSDTYGTLPSDGNARGDALANYALASQGSSGIRMSASMRRPEAGALSCMRQCRC